MTKEDAFHWFVQGFKQSSEGYNGEIAVPYLVPAEPCTYRGWSMTNEVEISDETREQLRELFEEMWEEA